MNKVPPVPSQSPFETQSFEGESGVFDPSNVATVTTYVGGATSHPTIPADVHGALVKFSEELPDSAEALLGNRPEYIPTQPANINMALDKAARVLPPTAREVDAAKPNKDKRALRYGRNALLASLAIGATAVATPGGSRPESAQQRVNQGASQASLQRIAQERADLGMPATNIDATERQVERFRPYK